MMRHLLAVVMDGLKDTEMIAGYAEHAMKHGTDRSIVNWFKTRAQNRLAMVERDWKDVDDQLHTDKHDDELVEALECHVNRSLANLREKIEVNPKNPKYVKVVWGVGYKLEKQK